MNKFLLSILMLASSCSTGNLEVIGDLPKTLDEISGIETTGKSELIWTLNDGNNPAKLYGISAKGSIVKTLKIDAKNIDWEDLTSDSKGNLYIGAFGNNNSARKDLSVLRIQDSDLEKNGKLSVERIFFNYDNQTRFPPKKKNLYFDSEAFLWHNDSLYIFTKSRVKGHYGKTNLYKIPATQGRHTARFVNSFNSCDDLPCWITAADISADGKKMALLNHQSVWVFSDFKDDDFFSGTVKEYPFNHESQKESVCFKNDSTLYIADETSHGKGGNLYEFDLTNH
jgi:hypothetical protein